MIVVAQGLHAARRGAGYLSRGPMNGYDTLVCLALSRMSFLKPRERLRLAAELETPDAFLRLGRRGLEEMLGRRLRTEPGEPGGALEQAEADRRRLILEGIGCILYTDSRYPRMLHETYDPPLVLFTRGSRRLDGSPAVGVVGTRKPLQAARSAARELGRVLASAGVTVVSGLARGIDGEAHRGAVRAGGRHVAVLGCGLLRILPETNAWLGRRILALGGTLLSEYPPDEPPRKHHFPARNRIISALSQALVIVQAPERSGALITADFALQQGIEVLVHRAGLFGSRGAGGAALAESGAAIVEDGEGVLRLLGIEGPPKPSAPPGEGIGERLAREMELELEELD